MLHKICCMVFFLACINMADGIHRTDIGIFASNQCTTVSENMNLPKSENTSPSLIAMPIRQMLPGDDFCYSCEHSGRTQSWRQESSPYDYHT